MSKPKRFIILLQDGGRWIRSNNEGINKGNSFSTREEAQTALDANAISGLVYKIRQK
jgi:hypothetical protein